MKTGLPPLPIPVGRHREFAIAVPVAFLTGFDWGIPFYLPNARRPNDLWETGLEPS